jgi:hypothetical protein
MHESHKKGCFGEHACMVTTPSRGICKTSIELMAPWPLINRSKSSKLQAAVTATTMLPATHSLEHLPKVNSENLNYLCE